MQYRTIYVVVASALMWFQGTSRGDESRLQQFTINLLDESSLSLDLGEIPIRDGKQGSIRVLSGEEQSAVIVRKTSCGCVKLKDATESPTGEIVFRVSPSSIADRFVQKIEVHPIGGKSPVQITLLGRVVGPVSLSQSTIRFENNNEASIALRCERDNVQIKSVHALRGVLHIQKFEHRKDGAKERRMN